VAAPTDGRFLRAVAALLAVLATFVCVAPVAAADPNALWTIVNGECVPDQQRSADPAPCAQVDVGGYAVLKDLVGKTQFLLIPTQEVLPLTESQAAFSAQ